MTNTSPTTNCPACGLSTTTPAWPGDKCQCVDRTSPEYRDAVLATATTTYNGYRMLDVRMQIARDGGGLDHITKVDAGSYTMRTLDGRRWTITRQPSGLWHGAPAMCWSTPATRRARDES